MDVTFLPARPYLLLVMAVTLTTACQPRKATHEVVNTQSEDGYYALPGLDHGLLQSPVNILSKETKPGRHTIEVGPGDGARRVTNLGHTVEVGFGKGLILEFDDKPYELKQLHFHTPSEHQTDGITYPMEMHAVHTPPGQSKDAPPEYLVVAIFFRMGDSNVFLDSFLNAIPAEEGRSAKLKEVYFEDALPPGFDYDNIPHYSYRGSLTTPPYTESVQWLILKDVFEASPEQIRAINLIEGDNARWIQALYGRTIDE